MSLFNDLCNWISHITNSQSYKIESLNALPPDQLNELPPNQLTILPLEILKQIFKDAGPACLQLACTSKMNHAIVESENSFKKYALELTHTITQKKYRALHYLQWQNLFIT